MLIVNPLLTSIVAVVSLFPSCITGLAPPLEDQCPLVPSCCDEDCCGKGTSWDPPFCRFDLGASGFNGTYSDTFDKGCVERDCCENTCCSPGTWYDAILAVCLPSASFECIPTSGQCASTFSELEQALAEASANNIVAICGSDTPITTEYSLLVEKPNLPLCCLGLGHCTIQSIGTDRNLKVTGSDFTAQGIDFVGGKVDGFESGGNMIIDSAGNHEIIDCSFQNGEAYEGGNLAVRKGDNLALTKSSFTNGNAGLFGGGVDVYILGSFKIKVNGCTFAKNQADVSYGGGLHVTGDAEEISIKNSDFKENDAKRGGGGFLASVVGTLQSLEVLGCTFDGNVASNGDGAGYATLPSVEQFDFNLSGNSGLGNIASDECDDFRFFYRSPEEGNLKACIDVDQDVTNLPL